MVTMYGLLAIALVMIGLFPDTAAARPLRLWLIERPAAALSRFGLGRTIVIVLLVLIGVGLFWIGGAEGLRLFAMGAPEAFAWMAMFDAGAVIDLIAVAVIAQGASRLTFVRARLRRTLKALTTMLVRAPRRAARAVRCAVRRMTGRRDDAEPRPGRALQPAFG